jgi:vacuolar-type H+-ATPase subunit H
MSEEPIVTAPDSLESIKRVKSVESEAEARLSRLQEEIRQEMQTLTRESEELLLGARAESERSREQRLEGARVEADREAERLLSQGSARAEEIQGKSPEELASLREPILDEILGEFRAKTKRPES